MDTCFLLERILLVTFDWSSPILQGIMIAVRIYACYAISHTTMLIVLQAKDSFFLQSIVLLGHIHHIFLHARIQRLFRAWHYYVDRNGKYSSLDFIWVLFA